jgi:putative transposase
MVHNRHLSRAIMDMGFGECRRQLAYKAAMQGGIVIVVDKCSPQAKPVRAVATN